MLAPTPPEQLVLIATYPNIFVPVKGAWGSKGATNVRLQFATRDTVWPAMTKAWKAKANKTLVNKHPNLYAGAD